MKPVEKAAETAADRAITSEVVKIVQALEPAKGVKTAYRNGFLAGVEWLRNQLAHNVDVQLQREFPGPVSAERRDEGSTIGRTR